MSTSRRKFLEATAGLAGWALAGAPGRAATGTREKTPASSGIAAVAFDAFVVFDPRPMESLAEQVAPGHGRERVTQWRTRQFEYTWLRTIGGRHADFAAVTESALLWASRSLRLNVDAAGRRALVEAHSTLRAWPDVPAALASLRARGLRLA